MNTYYTLFEEHAQYDQQSRARGEVRWKDLQTGELGPVVGFGGESGVEGSPTLRAFSAFLDKYRAQGWEPIQVNRAASWTGYDRGDLIAVLFRKVTP
jgi:hypothetical protein